LTRAKFRKYFDEWKEEQLEMAYREWDKGNYYKYDGNFYEVGTGKYICPCE